MTKHREVEAAGWVGFVSGAVAVSLLTIAAPAAQGPASAKAQTPAPAVSCYEDEFVMVDGQDTRCIPVDDVDPFGPTPPGCTPVPDVGDLVSGFRCGATVVYYLD